VPRSVIDRERRPPRAGRAGSPRDLHTRLRDLHGGATPGPDDRRRMDVIAIVVALVSFALLLALVEALDRV
jgi:hypothetical protein